MIFVWLAEAGSVPLIAAPLLLVPAQEHDIRPPCVGQWYASWDIASEHVKSAGRNLDAASALGRTVAAVLEDAEFPPAADHDARAVRFPQGIPGFPTDHDYLLRPLLADGSLQELYAEGALGPSFVVIDPRLLDPAFTCEADEACLRTVGLAELPAEPHWLAIVTLPRDGEPARANLRSPLLINPEHGLGVQLIPERSRHGLREPLPPLVARAVDEVGAHAGLD
jgi:flagellar assembly factor FliW